MTTNPAAPALLPSLHALVEKWRDDGKQAWNVQVSGYRLIQCADELEALLSRAATTQAGEIERDKDYNRDYIPLPGGWEIQTKGRGSSYRICDTKSGERVNVTDERLHDFLTRMALEIRAAAPPSQPVAPVVADRYTSIIGMVCGNDPSCGESAVVWTKQGDMQCAECGHPMIAAAHPAQPQEREPRETTVPIVEGRRCPADGELCALRACTFECQCRTAVNPAEKRRELEQK
jgi:hypothetical protein